MKTNIFAIMSILLVGCATIVNDSHIPLTISFSDGSSGNCAFKNKRGGWETHIPTKGVMIRRSDDDLIYECTTKDGRYTKGTIRSEMESGKLAMSVIFWDLGITDAITDKHRTYQGNVVIPVMPREEVTHDDQDPGEVGDPTLLENIQAKQINSGSDFKIGETVYIELKDGTSKVITISEINDKSISGYYDYKEGTYQISDVWENDSITSIKHVKIKQQ